MSLAVNEGLRHVPEDDPFVIIPRKTVRNTAFTYRALGLLTYLADQAEGWVVRSDQLARGEGREGREAVRTALNELAAAGHYRLERRKKLNGKWVMGTAVSKRPIQQWIEDYEIFHALARTGVPLVQQADGTYRVQYPDGTLGSDGFGPAPSEEQELAPEQAPAPEVDEEPLPQAPASPAPRKTPPARVKGSGSKREAPEPDDRWRAKECAAHLGVSTQAWTKLVRDGDVPEHTGLKGTSTKVWDPALVKALDLESITVSKTAITKDAQEVATWWWEDARKYLGPYAGMRKNGYIVVQETIEAALRAGYTKRQCADALRKARQHIPSPQQWQRALAEASNYIVPTRPDGRVAYSDAGTWRNHETPLTTPSDGVPSGPDDDSDDVVFGVVKRP
ncbi:hypothetical protein ACFCWY_09160 [Streptomyces sp. NPDC056362]|uniref:hypothetical protein n=1 Tax=unclassified Streptomyces TaxID=2593676 RepID=UPI0035E1ADBD